MRPSEDIRADLALVEQIPLYEMDEVEDFTLDQHLAFGRICEDIPNYVELRDAVRRYVACSVARMQQEQGAGHCPHTKLCGGDQEVSCWALMVNALEGDEVFRV